MNYRNHSRPIHLAWMAASLLALMVPVGAAGEAAQLLGSTYLGGSAEEGQFLGASMARAPDGTVYLADMTESLDLPTTAGAHQAANAGRADVVVLRLSPDLKTLLACTYLGGSGRDGGLRGSPCLAVDTDGTLLVAGMTLSDDLPISPSAAQTVRAGRYDLFVARLDADLESVLACTLLGGSQRDWCNDLMVGTDGSVYLAGSTASSDFPATPGAYDESYGGGEITIGGDGFVARLSADLTELLGATYLGGSGWEYDGWLALASDGDILVAGNTASQDFPTTPGAYDEDHNQGPIGWGADVFVSRLSPDLSTLRASTLLGDRKDEWCFDLLADGAGSVYTTGHTSSEDFPTTPGAHDRIYDGPPGIDEGDEVFVCRLDEDLTELQASTFMGGTGWDLGRSLALAPGGDLLVAGRAGAVDFPTTEGAWRRMYAGTGYHYGEEVFLARLDADLTDLRACTFLGGDGQEGPGSLALDPAGRIYLSGTTNSTDFPVTLGAPVPEAPGGSAGVDTGDAFLCWLEPSLTAPPPEAWYRIDLPLTLLHPGDELLLWRFCGNPTDDPIQGQELAILDVLGHYWFWPSWGTDLELQPLPLEAGQVDTLDLLRFPWPEGAGEAGGLRFWGALIEPATDLLSYDMVEWGFAP